MTYRRLLRLAAVPVTNRRWAAPLSAIALGFGLFVGVAIGPGASGTLATGALPITVELPGSGGGTEKAVTGGGGESGGSSSVAQAAPGPSTSPQAAPSFAESAPVESESSPPEPASPEPEPGSAPPAEEKEPVQPQTLTGVVVHVNPAAGSYALAEEGGTLNAVHAGRTPAPGARVKVPVRLLANGTLAEAGKRVRVGGARSLPAKSAELSGVVSHVSADPASPSYTVSKRGVSLLVRVHPDPGGALPAVPALGALATVTVAIKPADAATPPEAAPVPPSGSAAEAPPACAPDPATTPPPAPAPSALLWQKAMSAPGVPFTYSDFEGIVMAICPQTGQLSISADDIREGSQDLVLDVPPEIDVGGIEVGESVTATADIAADGTLTLKGLASDERTKGADDPGATRGDLAVEPQTSQK